MKTVKELIKNKPVYLNDWSDKIDIISDFEDIYMSKDEYEAKEAPYPNVEVWHERKDKMKRKIEEWDNINILFASYGQANYSGDAWVLFEQGGKLYEVNGSHCSCFGLEGQWKPEEVVLEELKNRLLEGTWGTDDWSDNNFREELVKFLSV